MSSISVQYGDKTCILKAAEGENLLNVLRREHIPVFAPCGGQGKCGKCRVYIQGESVIACRVSVKDGMSVTVPSREQGISGIAVAYGLRMAGGHSGACSTGFAAAVDLGTTTVAVALTDLKTGSELSTACGWNCQAAYGADVITRAGYIAANGRAALSFYSDRNSVSLTAMIRSQVRDLIREAGRKAGLEDRKPEKIFLAGNTIMQHIFYGLSPESITRAPFIPFTRFTAASNDRLDGIPVEYAPCVSGYVGGDITSGIAATGIRKAPDTVLFLDIGTNGEMAISKNGHLICCSVASGPAFEGSGITCGMTATEGAVSRVWLKNGKIQYETLDGDDPHGICGSGLIDLAAVLLKCGFIDGTGRLQSPDDLDEGWESFLGNGMALREDKNGNGVFYLSTQVYLTAADVRQLQLAKAAVAAGIRILMRTADAKWEEISRLCVAGGFGLHIDPENAAVIGLIPSELQEKFVPCGNTSLAGAVQALYDDSVREEMLVSAKEAQYIELSGNSEFNNEFTDQLIFDEEE